MLPDDGVVDQIMEGYIRDGIAKAQREGATAVVIQLDTPGGALDATREIVKTLLNSPLPVIVWVGPAGAARRARARSSRSPRTWPRWRRARTSARRRPSTRPGEDIGEDLKAKVLEDTQALLRSISTERDRNLEWALTTVTEARSYTADEAVARGRGRRNGTHRGGGDRVRQRATVNVNGQPVTLDLAGAEPVEVPMNPLQGVLHLLSDPNIAFILFTLGFYGLLFELQSPNFVTGILGGIAIILAFIGFGSLPLNLAGLLLIGLAIVLFILELTVTSHGLLAIGGIVCFVLGAAALYTEPGTPTAPDVSVAWPVIAAMTLVTAAFMALIVLAAVRTRSMGTAEGLIGAGLPSNATGEVRRPLNPIGSVYAGGEEWTARAVDERTLERGTPVQGDGQEGLTLVVEPFEGSGHSQPSEEGNRCLGYRRALDHRRGRRRRCCSSCTCRSGWSTSTSAWSCSGSARPARTSCGSRD